VADWDVQPRVVVGVDPRLPSRNALLLAQSIASTLDAAVDAITVWDITAVMAEDWVDSWDPEREAATRLSEIVADVLGPVPAVPVREAVRRGRPVDQLIEASRDARMLVLGRRRRAGLARLLGGSVATRCAARAHCPVTIAGDHTTAAEAVLMRLA
jgi:nucleotide-binding universal stress UspA family protein